MPTPPTRRQFLARAAILAAGAPTLGAFLRRARSRMRRRPSGPSLTLAAPDNPVKWPHRRRQQADRRRARAREGRDAQDLQLRRLSQPSGRQGVRGQVPAKIEISTFNDGDEAITKIRSGVDFDIYNANYTEISRLVNGGLIRPLNHSYIPEHQERVAELHQPLVRPGVALHRSLHHLHHRHRLADRPGARRYRRDEESVRRVVGSRSTRARPPCSTTGTPRWPWCFCAKASRTSTPRRRPT